MKGHVDVVASLEALVESFIEQTSPLTDREYEDWYQYARSLMKWASTLWWNGSTAEPAPAPSHHAGEPFVSPPSYDPFTEQQQTQKDRASVKAAVGHFREGLSLLRASGYYLSAASEALDAARQLEMELASVISKGRLRDRVAVRREWLAAETVRALRSGGLDRGFRPNASGGPLEDVMAVVLRAALVTVPEDERAPDDLYPITKRAVRIVDSAPPYKPGPVRQRRAKRSTRVRKIILATRRQSSKQK